MTVALLARELGVRPNAVLRWARDCGINVVRVGALLAPAQAEAIRAAADASLRKATERAARVPVPPRVVVRAARSVPPVAQAPSGPDHACGCCGLRLPTPSSRAAPEQVRYCERCRDHFPVAGEPVVRTSERLNDHDVRLRKAYVLAWDQVQSAMEQARDRKRSRDAWRRSLVEVMTVHEETPAHGCKCGAKVFPCPTWKALERTNKGVLKQVEDFLALSDDEREERLYDWSQDHGAA